VLPTKLFKKKQFIYTEGETANEMYIIKSGEVKIVKHIKKDPVEIATLKKGDFFGEVALFSEKKHSATAVAETDLELALINKEIFNQQLELLPHWFQTIIRSMAGRLQNANEQLGMLNLPSLTRLTKDESTESQEDND